MNNGNKHSKGTYLKMCFSNIFIEWRIYGIIPIHFIEYAWNPQNTFIFQILMDTRNAATPTLKPYSPTCQHYN